MKWFANSGVVIFIPRIVSVGNIIKALTIKETAGYLIIS